MPTRAPPHEPPAKPPDVPVALLESDEAPRQKNACACVVLRGTLRLHDNPVLSAALDDPSLGRVVLPIEAERVLDPDEIMPRVRRGADGAADADGVLEAAPFCWPKTAPHAWGYHQYWFLLQALTSFAKALRRALPARVRVSVWKAPRARLVRTIAECGGTVYIDRVDDDAWASFDDALRAAAASRLAWRTTQTLLDWHEDPRCRRFLRERWLAGKPWPREEAGTKRGDGATGKPSSVQTKGGRRAGTGWAIPGSNKVLRDFVHARIAAGAGEGSDDGCGDARGDGEAEPPFAVDLEALCRAHDCHGKRRGRGHRPRSSRAPCRAPSSAADASRRRGSTRSPARRSRGGRARRTRRPPRARSYAPGDCLLTLDLDAEAARWGGAMRARGLRPYDTCRGDLEAYALRRLRASAPGMARTDWEKPRTNASLALRETDASRPTLNTSKLSPFLALGVLSARRAYVAWRGATPAARRQNADRPSSAVAQLLWRETFHAASRHPLWWARREYGGGAPLAPEQRFWRHEMREGAPGGGWPTWRLCDADDADGAVQAWRRADVEEDDLRRSLALLAAHGWIHHLRRHVVADNLTRGRRRADWMLGELWFRQTLVDHDPCINRGNWLWLSASDFSTAQRVRHYGYRDYVQRHSSGDVRGHL